MVKNREINGTEEIGLVTPTPGPANQADDGIYVTTAMYTMEIVVMCFVL